jgi:hypothetical protein
MVLWCPLVIGFVAGWCVAAPEVRAQGLGRRYEINELRQMVADAEYVVRAKALAAPVSRGGDPGGLVWQMSFEVLEKLKGEGQIGRVVLRFRSPTGSLKCSRIELPGKEYVLPVVAYQGEAGQYKLVDKVAFPAESPEAKTVVRLAGGDVEPEPAVSRVRLRLDAANPPYEVGKPILLRIALDNTSDKLVAYQQAPFEVRGGQLYILGEGNLVVTDSRRSRSVPMRENVHLKTLPPPPLMPMAIAGSDAYKTELDLSQFFEFDQAGLYMVTMAAVEPDGQGLVRSNTCSLQVIAPLTAPVEIDAPQRTAADSLLIPAPEAYKPGEIANGLSALLRPSRAEFVVGHAIGLELRLVNRGDRSFNVDTRLERALSFTVTAQGDSPAARERSQYLSWPETKPENRAYAYSRLRPNAFWGKEVNVNSLYGRDRAKMDETARAVLKGAVEPSYETTGMTLFAFEKPGVYKIRATFEMAPVGDEGPRLWAGKLKSNPIFIRVVAAAGDEAAAPVSSE